MNINLMAGGGLSSWYVVAKLANEGHQVSVWLAEVGQIDEVFKGFFIQSLHDKGVAIEIEDNIIALADFGLEIARYQGCYPNGYWNNTSLLRCYLVGKVCEHLPSDVDLKMTHGCVGYGNDQQRFGKLFETLNKKIIVETALANWFDTGSNPTRQDMIDYIENWANLPKNTLLDKVTWSSDGSILGVSHEGIPVEDVQTDWTQVPFVMTKNPLEDMKAETVEFEFKAGELKRVGDMTGSSYDVFQQANVVAGEHGIGRIGVMEDKLRGTKCRGIYEAPALTLLGGIYRQLYDLMLSPSEQIKLNDLSKQYAQAVYAGEYYTIEIKSVRKQLAELTQHITATTTVILRGGHFFVQFIKHEQNTDNLEQRFSHGGVAWTV